MEYYKFKKLDPKNEADWKEIELYFSLPNLSDEKVDEIKLDGKQLLVVKEYK